MTRKWQQRAPKACVTFADPYADRAADTAHKTSWGDAVKTKLSTLTKEKSTHIQVYEYLNGKFLNEGTKQAIQ